MIKTFHIAPRPSSAQVRDLAAAAEGEFVLLLTKETGLRWVDFGLERMLEVARDTGAVLVYADHFNETARGVTPAPVIDYQTGSLRDDFEFGSVLLVRTEAPGIVPPRQLRACQRIPLL